MPGRVIPGRKGDSMTGREAVEYILNNRYDNQPLVVYIDGKEVPVWDICYEMGRKNLVILPDYEAGKDERK